jgi:L-lactate dehydrogenase (cytochrome)
MKIDVASWRSRRLRKVLSLDDMADMAQRLLPVPLRGFIAGGSETAASVAANRAAFAKWSFVPRVLRNTSARSQTATLFGRQYAGPFGVSPMGVCGVFAFDADRVLAKACSEAGVPFVLSGMSMAPMEAIVAKHGPDYVWYDAYMPSERSQIDSLIDRVERAGFHTMVVTVDVPVAGNRENNIRNGFTVPLRPTPALAWQGITHPDWLFGTLLRTLLRYGLPYVENYRAERGAPFVSRKAQRDLGQRDRVDWDDIAHIRDRWRGKLIIKGVLAVEDAVKARSLGLDGVTVSNHGGRQLDGAVAALDALPNLVAVAGDMTVMLDGGVRRGTDVLKALALGAKFVFLGRPMLYGAVVAGSDGVAHVIRLLSREIDRNLAMLGRISLDEVTPDLLVRTG